MNITFNVNGKSQTVDVAPDTPLLWVLRDTLGMTGTKFGCGKALCGACTVHLNGMAIRSCQTPIGSVAGQKVTTIEGLGNNKIQQAWIALDVLKDAAENTAATFSFYARLALLHWIGSGHGSDANQAIYDRLTEAHPDLSRLYLSCAVAMLLCATALALDRALRLHRNGASWIPARWLANWMPVLALVLANAFAFALIADLIVVRFVIFAHAVLLALVYRAALLEMLPLIRRTQVMAPSNMP